MTGWRGPEKGQKGDQRIGKPAVTEKLGELGWDGLGKRRLRGDFIAVSSISRVAAKKMEMPFSQRVT